MVIASRVAAVTRDQRLVGVSRQICSRSIRADRSVATRPNPRRARNSFRGHRQSAPGKLAFRTLRGDECVAQQRGIRWPGSRISKLVPLSPTGQHCRKLGRQSTLASTLMVIASTPRLKKKPNSPWSVTTRRMRREEISRSAVWQVIPITKAK